MIGGNIDLIIKTKTSVENEIGEKIPTWSEYITIHGFLDLMSEQIGRNVYNSKITSSSHVFICDYQEIDKDITEIKAKCNNKEFDIEYIDDPMNLHEHLEIFLKYVGD